MELRSRISVDSPNLQSFRIGLMQQCPASGIVIRVAVQVGQTLQTGDVLPVLEAMKMETNIAAPGPGKIAAIPVHEGDSVQSGQVVVEFE